MQLIEWLWIEDWSALFIGRSSAKNWPADEKSFSVVIGKWWSWFPLGWLSLAESFLARKLVSSAQWPRRKVTDDVSTVHCLNVIEMEKLWLVLLFLLFSVFTRLSSQKKKSSSHMIARWTSPIQSERISSILFDKFNCCNREIFSAQRTNSSKSLFTDEPKTSMDGVVTLFFARLKTIGKDLK